MPTMPSVLGQVSGESDAAVQAHGSWGGQVAMKRRRLRSSSATARLIIFIDDRASAEDQPTVLRTGA